MEMILVHLTIFFLAFVLLVILFVGYCVFKLFSAEEFFDEFAMENQENKDEDK